MTKKQVTYTRPTDSATKFVLNIEDSAFHELDQGAPSNHLGEDSYHVMRAAPDGTLYPASDHELQDVFGTTDHKYVSHFMVRQGQLEGPLLEDLKKNTKPN